MPRLILSSLILSPISALGSRDGTSISSSHDYYGSTHDECDRLKRAVDERSDEHYKCYTLKLNLLALGQQASLGKHEGGR
jgi:hypothetical protein